MSNFDFDNDNNMNVAELIAQFEQSVKNDNTPFFDQDDFEAIVEYYEEKGQFEQAWLFIYNVIYCSLPSNKICSSLAGLMAISKPRDTHNILFFFSMLYLIFLVKSCLDSRGKRTFEQIAYPENTIIAVLVSQL